MTTIAERLKEARIERGLSQKALARLAGVSAGTVGNIEAGARDEPQKLVEIAAAAQVTPGWLKLGKGPKRPPGWIDPHHPSEGLPKLPVAQNLSYPQSEDEPQQHTWEFILSAVILPARFRLAVPDDALAPSTPKGTILIFEPAAPPVFGHGVLVEDAAGQRYVRKYAQGPGGGWRAVANNPAYLMLDSADGARVLAAVTWRATGEV